MKIPGISFGEATDEESLPEEDDTKDDDEEMAKTDSAVVEILGFDPLDLEKE